MQASTLLGDLMLDIKNDFKPAIRPTQRVRMLFNHEGFHPDTEDVSSTLSSYGISEIRRFTHLNGRYYTHVAILRDADYRPKVVDPRDLEIL